MFDHLSNEWKLNLLQIIELFVQRCLYRKSLSIERMQPSLKWIKFFQYCFAIQFACVKKNGKPLKGIRDCSKSNEAKLIGSTNVSKKKVRHAIKVEDI